MTPPVLRLFELRGDAACAALVREEERLQAWRRTHEFRVSREIEDMMVRRRERGV
ncbi:MAG: hypothetical protein ACP5QO_13500 [Clostridia bacterium]